MSKRRPESVDDERLGDEHLDDEQLDEKLGDVDVPSTIPLKVRRSLREVLGDEGEQVEQVWLDALSSDNERIRVDAAKTLTTAVVALSKAGEGSSVQLLIPKSVEDVELLTLEESMAALSAIYITEMQSLTRHHEDEEETIRRFRQNHPDLELPLALLVRALGQELR
jgi:hypothetical protein